VLPVFIAGATARLPNSPVFGLSCSSVHNPPLISCSSPLAMMLNSMVIIPPTILANAFLSKIFGNELTD